MNFISFKSLLLMAALAAPAMAAPGPAPAPAPTSTQVPAKVAITNPSRIFNDMAETKALREKLETRRKELMNKELEQRNAIEQLIKQRTDTNPNHPKYIELSEQIDIAKANLQAWGVSTKASVDRDQKLMVKKLYDKIEIAIGEVAQQNNIDLVIADGRQEVTNLEEVTPEELRRLLNTRNILYATKAVDLTEKVITLLNAKLAKETASASVAPAIPK